MKPIQIVLLALLLLLAVLTAYLVLRNPQPPLLPRDDVHATFVNAETCLACHGPQGNHPRSPNHPLGRECLRCHGRGP